MCVCVCVHVCVCVCVCVCACVRVRVCMNASSLHNKLRLSVLPNRGLAANKVEIVFPYKYHFGITLDRVRGRSRNQLCAIFPQLY